MAWTSVVTHGDTVETPHGRGTVRRVSEAQGTAQVEVNGQLFEVPSEQVTKAEGGQPVPEAKPEKKATPVKPWNVKPGDRVQTKSGKNHGEVTEVTQRSVKVKFDNGDKKSYNKREVGHSLDKEQKGEKQEFKEGDRVKATQENEWVKPGMTGTVRQTSQHETQVKWDDANERGWGEDDAEWSMPNESIAKDEPEKEVEKPEQEKPVEQKAKDTADDLYGLLQLKAKLEQKIDSEVDGEMQKLRELAKQNQKLEVKVGDKVNVIKGLRHKQLEQLINYAALRLSPLLVGMAGTGKTHAGEQTAVALGLDFYSMSVGAQTSKSDIIGYMAANGQYVSTHFRKAYEEGGVFLMDEIDAGNSNVLIQINAALSNGLCAFPDAMVKQHEDFVFIASANTFGNGANRQYVGRNQLDAATLDRFAVIEWFIDDELESQLTTGINGKAWYMAVRAAREYVAEKNIRALISPRATQKGSKLLHVGQDLKEVIHATMLGSVPEDKKADIEDVATSIFNKFASEVPSQLPKQVNPEVRDLLKEDIDLNGVPF